MRYRGWTNGQQRRLEWHLQKSLMWVAAPSTRRSPLKVCHPISGTTGVPSLLTYLFPICKSSCHEWPTTQESRTVLLPPPPSPVEAQAPYHGTKYEKKSKDGFRPQIRRRTTTWRARHASKGQPSGSSRVAHSSHGSQLVRSCGSTENVCCSPALPFDC